MKKKKISCHSISANNIVLVRWYLNALFYDQSFVVLIVGGRTYNAMQYNDNGERKNLRASNVCFWCMILAQFLNNNNKKTRCMDKPKLLPVGVHLEISLVTI